MTNSSKRAVYVGGFGGSWGMAESVGRALARFYPEVEVSTFAHSMKNPEVLARAIDRAHVYTHSAGAVAVAGSMWGFAERRPEIIRGIAPPDGQKSAIGLLQATFGKKSQAMFRQARQSWTDAGRYLRYMRQETAEVAAHPVGNLRYLGQIASTNIVETAQRSGVPTVIYGMSEDYYFDWSHNPNAAAISRPDISSPVHFHVLQGQHDLLAMQPDATVRLALEACVGETTLDDFLRVVG